MKRMPFHRSGSTFDRKMWAISVFLFAGFLLLPSLPRAGEVDQLQTRAKLGEIKAQVQLGEKYFRGEGVPQNYTEAYRWFTKAAERGNPAGQYRIGQMYALGLGVLRDDAEAVRWYSLSAEQGHLAHWHAERGGGCEVVPEGGGTGARGGTAQTRIDVRKSPGGTGERRGGGEVV